MSDEINGQQQIRFQRPADLIVFMLYDRAVTDLNAAAGQADFVGNHVESEKMRQIAAQLGAMRDGFHRRANSAIQIVPSLGGQA